MTRRSVGSSPVGAAVAAASFAALAACGGPSGPPAGPAYEPVASPEAHTPCVGEHAAAKKAREAMLGAEASPARLAAARAVFAQAECERGHFDRFRFQSSSQLGQVEAIRDARAQLQNAVNLYAEVISYGELELLHAGARLGDLYAAFAGKLRSAQPPAELTDPGQRAQYTAELAELAVAIDRDAAIAYGRALDAAAAMSGIGGFDARTADWVRDACAQLGTIDPRGRADQPVCR